MAHEQYRNVALVGHGNAGKTTTAEGLLFRAKAVARWGSVDEKNSALDYQDDEKAKGYSINASLAHFTERGATINLIDTPGKPDFRGELVGALSAVETALITIAANAGVQVNTRAAFQLAGENGCARAILVTKVDAENVRVDDTLSGIRELFGDRCLPVNWPIGEGAGFERIVSVIEPGDDAPDEIAEKREALIERAVEADDAVMEAYLETMEIDSATFATVFKRAVATGVVIPVLFVSRPTEQGYDFLLDAIVDYFPSPADLDVTPAAFDGNAARAYQKAADERRRAGMTAPPEVEPIEPPEPMPLPDGAFVARVFKTVTDPFVQKLSFLRVYRGSLASDASFTNVRVDATDKSTGFLHVIGREHTKTDRAEAGDIVVLAKVDSLAVGDTITDGAPVALATQNYPIPMVARAVFPKTQKDVDKLGDALRRLVDEDPTFSDRIDPITKERVVAGLSDLHLGILLDRLQKRYKVDVNTQIPKVPYQETVTGTASGVYRHKKQTGGAGEFAEVHLEVRPTDERGLGVEFEDAIVGGAIDRQYIPAVEKGVREQARRGIVAGFPVVDVHVKLYDGKTHPVDSKDRAFQRAGREGLKQIVKNCKPRMLEPYMEIEVSAPTDFVGDILGDLTGQRRGRPLDQGTEGNVALIKAHVPLAEVLTYSQTLQSITGGEGHYVMRFAHYDLVPEQIAQGVIAKYQKADTDD